MSHIPAPTTTMFLKEFERDMVVQYESEWSRYRPIPFIPRLACCDPLIMHIWTCLHREMDKRLQTLVVQTI